MIRLAALFILVPIMELALLIELGRHIGTPSTLGIIVATGALGAYLARRQGLGVLRQARREVAQGVLPVGSLADGLMILLAGAVLITPGVLTDVLGFLCLIPATRKGIRTFLWRRLKRAMKEGRIQVSVNPRGSPVSNSEERPVGPDSKARGRRERHSSKALRSPSPDDADPD